MNSPENFKRTYDLGLDSDSLDEMDVHIADLPTLPVQKPDEDDDGFQDRLDVFCDEYREEGFPLTQDLENYLAVVKLPVQEEGQGWGDYIDVLEKWVETREKYGLPEHIDAYREIEEYRIEEAFLRGDYAFLRDHGFNIADDGNCADEDEEWDGEHEEDGEEPEELDQDAVEALGTDGNYYTIATAENAYNKYLSNSGHREQMSFEAWLSQKGLSLSDFEIREEDADLNETPEVDETGSETEENVRVDDQGIKHYSSGHGKDYTVAELDWLYYREQVLGRDKAQETRVEFARLHDFDQPSLIEALRVLDEDEGYPEELEASDESGGELDDSDDGYNEELSEDGDDEDDEEDSIYDGNPEEQVVIAANGKAYTESQAREEYEEYLQYHKLPGKRGMELEDWFKYSTGSPWSIFDETPHESDGESPEAAFEEDGAF